MMTKERFEYLTNLYSQSEDGMCLLKDGEFIYCNDAILDILKCTSKEELLDSHISQLAPKYQPDGEKSYEKIQKMINKSQIFGFASFEWLYISKKQMKWMEILFTKISSETIHVVWKDITQKKELEDEVKQLQYTLELQARKEIDKNKKKEQHLLEQSRLAQMGEMISMIAHQWRQPLGAISSTTLNLRMQIELNNYDLDNKLAQEDCKSFFIKELNDIEEYVKNLTNTIDDFRNFYKPNKESKVITVDKPILNALSIIKTSLEVNGIKIIQQFDSTKKINLYDSEIMHVILNILKNSQDNFKLKEIDDEYIKITTTDIAEGVKIDIEDNAGGIPYDVLPNIFDPYFSTKDEKNGTGLGLYMSKIIVEDHHNGKVDAKNTDNGANFTIILEDSRKLKEI